MLSCYQYQVYETQVFFYKNIYPGKLFLHRRQKLESKTSQVKCYNIVKFSRQKQIGPITITAAVLSTLDTDTEARSLSEIVS